MNDWRIYSNSKFSEKLVFLLSIRIEWMDAVKFQVGCKNNKQEALQDDVGSSLNDFT